MTLEHRASGNTSFEQLGMASTPAFHFPPPSNQMILYYIVEKALRLREVLGAIFSSNSRKVILELLN